jgi:hypothetical protein
LSAAAGFGRWCLVAGYWSLVFGYWPLAANALIINSLLIILGSFCAEDYLYLAQYQSLTDQRFLPVRGLKHTHPVQNHL